jgi:hypothetical protein
MNTELGHSYYPIFQTQIHQQLCLGRNQRNDPLWRMRKKNDSIELVGEVHKKENWLSSYWGKSNVFK